MKKCALILSCIGVMSSSFADVAQEDVSLAKQAPINNSFGYFDIGVGPLPFLVPTFGVGHRNQWGHHGLDLSFNASTIVALTSVKQSVSYLYYFTPNLRSQVYFGCGLAGGGLFSNHGEAAGMLAPQFFIGKEYTNKVGGHRFIQAGINFPSVFFQCGADVCWFPLVTVSYGFAF